MYRTRLIREFAVQAALVSASLDLCGEANELAYDLKLVEAAPGGVTRIHGSVGDGGKGLPVAGGYDCDGDGHVDTAFASIQANPLGRTRAGEITLIFGDSSIGGVIDTAGFQAGVLKIAGDQNFEVAGAEIWIDDVTGDSLGDLLICRQNYTPGGGREGAGALSILNGGSVLRDEAEKLDFLDLRSPPASVTIMTLVGVMAYDRFEIWVRTGDVTGDGIADIVVGSDEVDGDGESNRGAVYVIRGGDHLAADAIIDLQSFGTSPLSGHVARILPPPDSDRYHMGSTCQIADLDGNGRGEVLACGAALNRAGAGIRLPGAPSGTGESSGSFAPGTLYIAWDDNFPTEAWTPGYEFVICDPTIGSSTRIEGAEDFNDSFGEEIVGGLDYDGDGLADLFVGDLTADTSNGFNSGAGHVFYGAEGLKGLSFGLDEPPPQVASSLILGPRSGSIGADTVAHGDYDNDGIDDLIIGNPHDRPQGRTSAGTMHVIYGKLGGWPETIDLSPANLPSPAEVRIAVIEGANGTVIFDNGDTLCYSAASGDIDGDGHSDIIVNEMVGNGLAPGTVDVGNLLLISGAALLEAPFSFEDWSSGSFSGGQEETGPNEDPDRDGRSNHFEFLFALDPEEGGGDSSLPTVSEEGGKIRLTYTRTANVGYVEWIYEYSENLIDWQIREEGTDYTVISLTDNGDGSETVVIELTDESSNLQSQFLRVRALTNI